MTSSSRSRQSGFSLLELIISFVLMLMLLTLMFSFLIPTLRAAARGQARVDMQQQAIVALGRICADLSQSSGAGVSFNTPVYAALTAPVTTPPTPATPPVIIGVQTLKEVGNNGQEWNTSVDVFSWNGTEITERNCPTGTDGVVLPGNQPVQLSDAILTVVAGDISLSPVRVLATGVTSFAVVYPIRSAGGPGPVDIQTQDGYDATPVTLEIGMSLQAATGSTTPEVFTFSRTAAMRNND